MKYELSYNLNPDIGKYNPKISVNKKVREAVVKKVTLTQVLSCKFCGIFKNFPVTVFGATKLLLTIFVGDDIDVKMERSSFY